MDPPDYKQIYKTPEEFRVPTELKELASDTKFPNENSTHYRLQTINKLEAKLPSNFQALDVNSQDNVLIGANGLSDSFWNGYIWSYEALEDFQTDENASIFRSQISAAITAVKYVENNLFLLTTCDGGVSFYSTRSEVRSDKPYCLFRIGEAHDHVGIVLTMDLFKQRKTLACTGDSQGCLKIWNIGEGDLLGAQTIRYAHQNAVTGIATSPVIPTSMATCGRDKKALLWDIRSELNVSAIKLFTKHKVHFTSIDWVNDELITLGDQSGQFHVVDKRQPMVFLKSTKAFESPIGCVTERNGLTAVCADTHIVKIFNASDETPVHQKNDGLGLVRQLKWVGDRELYGTGFEKQLFKFKF